MSRSEELKEITTDSKRKVAVSGKINNPGIIDVPEGATLQDIIDLCGGILNLLSKAFFIKGSKFSPILDLKILEIINPPTIDTTNK